MGEFLTHWGFIFVSLVFEFPKHPASISVTLGGAETHGLPSPNWSSSQQALLTCASGYHTTGSHLVLSHRVLCYQHSASWVPSTSTSSLSLSFSCQLSTSFCLICFSQDPAPPLVSFPLSFPPLCLPLPFFLPHLSPVLLSFTRQLKGISTSLLTLSCFFLGGTTGICQALQLSHFSRLKPPLGPFWCGRASANLEILSCLSSLTSLNLGLMLHQLGQPVALGAGSKSRTSRSCVR